jgi:hypothetical protein
MQSRAAFCAVLAFLTFFLRAAASAEAAETVSCPAQRAYGAISGPPAPQRP